MCLLVSNKAFADDLSSQVLDLETLNWLSIDKVNYPSVFDGRIYTVYAPSLQKKGTQPDSPGYRQSSSSNGFARGGFVECPCPFPPYYRSLLPTTSRSISHLCITSRFSGLAPSLWRVSEPRWTLFSKPGDRGKQDIGVLRRKLCLMNI